MLERVPLLEKHIDDYAGIVGEEVCERIRSAAAPFQGARVLHLNATAYGGGVAELLATHVPLLRSVGVEAEWQVLRGSDEFFGVTKEVHNGLQGAPLEKLGNVAAGVLGRIDLPGTLIPAAVLNGRSAGIKDLRHGYVREEEWQGRDPDAVWADHRGEVALPPHIRWCFVAATVAADPRHPASHGLGDLLVRVESASGPADPPPFAHRAHAGGIHHAAVQVDPRVYEIIRAFVRSEDAGGTGDAGAGAALR